LRARGFAQEQIQNDVPIQVEWIRDPKNLFWPRQEWHRFVWDLHYALPKRGAQIILGAGRAYGGAGQLHREAHRDGRAARSRWTIKLDPRVKTPQDALARQFSLASKLASKIGGKSQWRCSRLVTCEKQIERARKKRAATQNFVGRGKTGKKARSSDRTDRDGGFGLFGLAAPQGA